jgi:hypothetical protein
MQIFLKSLPYKYSYVFPEPPSYVSYIPSSSQTHPTFYYAVKIMLSILINYHKLCCNTKSNLNYIESFTLFCAVNILQLSYNKRGYACRHIYITTSWCGKAVTHILSVSLYS